MSNHTQEHTRIDIRPRTVGIAMAAVVLGLGAMYSATTLIRFFMQDEVLPELYRYFHLSGEANLPAYISGLYLLLAGVLLTSITLHERKNRGTLTLYWLGLAIGFLYMSVDEVTQIHDGLIDHWLNTLVGEGEGIWEFGWTRAYIPIVMIVGALYIPFLKQIPSRYTKLFILAGFVYVAGAVITEMIGSYVWTTFTRDEGVPMSLVVLVEETGELFGVVILVYALLSYIADRGITYQITVNSSRSANEVKPAAETVNY